MTTKKTALATTTKKSVTKVSRETKVTANSDKFNTVLSMSDIIELAHAHNICFYATNNTSTQYRIFNGKSSLNIKKSMYILYATTTDFDNIELAHIDGVNCERDKNSVDGKRPHKVTIKPSAIDNVFSILEQNALNKMQ